MSMVFSVCLLLLISFPVSAAVNYSESAHGDSEYGVFRTGLDSYVVGNCGHCHEQHASLLEGVAQDSLVFSQTDQTVSGSYTVDDNFCFQCHSADVTNNDYSATFAGYSASTGTGGGTPTSIMDAFNLSHSHDLNDIYAHARKYPSEFPWFKAGSNPCTACHNPHIARRNQDDPDLATLSVMSMPDEHDDLYGDGDGDGDSSDGDEGSAVSERMGRWSGAPVYVPPNAEPSAQNTPDYNAFCLYCHDKAVDISNDDRPYYHGGQAGELLAIKWLENGGDGVQSGTYIVPGDKHGYNISTGYAAVDAPFNITAGTNDPGDIILSCMNCHEAHGSENDYMHRRSINGVALGVVISGVTNERGAHCTPCHTEDADGGWKDTHHGGGFANDNPYTAQGHTCDYCHGASQRSNPDFPIPCEDCHFHGSYVDENDKYSPTGIANGVKYVKPDFYPYRRKTF